jgi:N-acetylgalactosamine-6-sulfatase
MTGHFPARNGVHGHFANQERNKQRGMPNYLDPGLPTMTKLLQNRGYVTGMFGKWHLGGGPGAPLPDVYGFDEHKTCASNDPRGKKEFNLFAAENRPVATKLVMDETIEFIKNNKDKPFYVNAWLSDTHAPLNPSEEQMKPYERFSPKRSNVDHKGAEQIYYATAHEADRQIGIFMDKLKELGIADNTIVIFSSDNGPEDIHIWNAAHSGVGSAGPLRGRKRSLYEGGVRVPFIVRWPKGTPAGKVNNESVIAGVDLFPTFCSLARIDLPDSLNLDGEDMSAAIRGNSSKRKKPLMWEWRYRIFGHVFHMSPMLAIREGKWKLLINPDKSRTELYDIPKDPREMNNVAAEHTDIVKKLSQKVIDWQKTLPNSPVEEQAGDNGYPWPK